MRYALILALLPVPAAGWEFSATPICTLSHDAADSAVAVTYDHGTGLYEIGISLTSGTWVRSATFGMQFANELPLTIGTDRHRLSQGNARLSVSDSGFGNVLNGLEGNSAALAFTPLQQVAIDTDGIQEPMQAFRACTQAPPATS